MATIRKREGEKTGTDGKVRKTVRYQAVVRLGGHPPQYGSFRTKTEAKEWATSIEDAINKDEHIPNREAKRRTVSEVLERYRQSELSKKRDKVNVERYLNFWIARIGNLKLTRVTRPLIIEIRDEMLADKSPATVNRYLATLRHAFRLACVDWGWLNTNPVQHVILTEPRGRVRHLSDDEIKALLASAKESEHPHLYAIVLIALTTGARRGEIASLRWKDVDLSTRRAILHETKNDERRTLAIVPQVVDELKKLRKVRRIDDDLIFANLNNGKRTYSTVESAWQIAIEKAKLDDFRFHDLRHTFASHLVMSGVDMMTGKALLGHATLTMTMRYSHLAPDHRMRAIKTLDFAYQTDTKTDTVESSASDQSL